jgi:hypothetical protein
MWSFLPFKILYINIYMCVYSIKIFLFFTFHGCLIIGAQGRALIH